MSICVFSAGYYSPLSSWPMMSLNKNINFGSRAAFRAAGRPIMYNFAHLACDVHVTCHAEKRHGFLVSLAAPLDPPAACPCTHCTNVWLGEGVGVSAHADIRNLINKLLLNVTIWVTLAKPLRATFLFSWELQKHLGGGESLFFFVFTLNVNGSGVMPDCTAHL